jgi:hypothetical protein
MGFLQPCLVLAQGGGNLRQKMVAVGNLPLAFDSLSTVPGSFSIRGVAPTQYRLDEVNSMLTWTLPPRQDSVQLLYRVFPSRLNQPTYRYRYDSIASFFKLNPGKAVTVRPTAANKIADFGSLRYTGSFGRSISFGNTQDAVVNALFNLQISGYLQDSIQISGAITDNNIPIQPDGTTQQLNEFDRIWLQFKRRPWEVNIGDIDMRQQPSYFLSYFKRQQGLAVEATQRIGKRLTNTVVASGAVAKGKFTRNIFQGLEGNQGPYRLTGASNELFFVVLAGTERVFIDGVQLQRGEDQDYVIDYNTAEITFTPKQLIQKDKRIQIEFEYADRNYLNSLLYLGTTLKQQDKWQLNLAVYSNADAKNSPLNQTINTEQRRFLGSLGDSIGQALYPVAVPDTFSTSKILYNKIDTFLNGQQYTLYRYQPLPAADLYSLSFSDLGAGNGNYEPSFNAANGKVFEWVAPLNGMPQGSYEPVAFLVTPKKLQQFTAAMQYAVDAHTTVKADIGISKNDINTYSTLQKGNDVGKGIKLLIEQNKLRQWRAKRLQTLWAGGYEFVDKQFRPLERLRRVEFLRDWGLPFETAPANEHLPSAKLQLADSVHDLLFQYTGYLRGDGYAGHRQQVAYNYRKKNWVVNSQFNLTNMDGNTFKGYFLRPNLGFVKTLSRWKNHQLGGGYSLEHNALRNLRTDTLLASSFSFTDWQAFLRSSNDGYNRWGLRYFSRANRAPVQGAFVPLDVNHTITANVELLKNLKHQFRFNGNYRMLTVKTVGITNQKSENSLLARAEYQLNVLKGGLTGNALYEVGAGQEQQRDFSYVEVPAGRGQFTWNDYNTDGVQQLNEFEEAQFTDQAKFIRIITPTNSFVKANYNTFNYALQLSPRAIWGTGAAGVKKWLAKVNLQSSLQTSRKQISNGGFQWNPFEGAVADTSLISLITNVANTISYNRFSSNWGVDLSNLRNATKAILTYGFETRQLNDYTLRVRKNFGRTITTELSGRKGYNRLTTPNPKFDNRNYNIDYFSIEPKFTYTRGAVWRFIAAYKYSHKNGSSSFGQQQAMLHTLSADAKYNVVQSSVLTAKFTYTNIDFNGPTNSTVAYIMLDALQPGRNLLWTADFTKRLGNALELSFQYEGRQAGTTKTVHIGRASLRAIL